MELDRRTFLRYAGVTALSFSGLGCIGGRADVKETVENVATTKRLAVYSGREVDLIGPIINRFRLHTGIDVDVRYGKTAELALAILGEGDMTPADLFFSQDAGALGALSKEGRLLKISDSLLDKVEPRFRSQKGEWIGITGRARTVDYNIKLVDRDKLPESIWGFTEPGWSGGKIGWAPTNGSFQAFVTAFRLLEGEKKTQEWLEGILVNEPRVYPRNSPILAALGRGEIHVGFVNNYYLHRFQAEDPGFPVAHHYTKGDAGSMINVAGLGILDTARDVDLAEKFIEYMLSEEAQAYYAMETYEYPLAAGVSVLGPQRPLSEIETPDIDLSDLDDLVRTLELLRQVGILLNET
jgi:iron(III) transport system substrate-binding protein